MQVICRYYNKPSNKAVIKEKIISIILFLFKFYKFSNLLENIREPIEPITKYLTLQGTLVTRLTLGPFLNLSVKNGQRLGFWDPGPYPA